MEAEVRFIGHQYEANTAQFFDDVKMIYLDNGGIMSGVDAFYMFYLSANQQIASYFPLYFPNSFPPRRQNFLLLLHYFE